MDKEKLLKKTKAIFFIEYLAIAAILLTVGLLRLFDIIPYSERRLLIYNILTLIGAAWIFFDFTWFLVSKTKRAKNDLIDKIFPVPLAIFLVVFDILTLAKLIQDISFAKYCIVGVLMYATAMAIFLGVYHFQKPSKMLIAAVEEEYQKMLEEEAQEQVKIESENKSEEDQKQ